MGVSYLLTPDCIYRVKEAIQLVEMYNSFHQSSEMTGMDALKVWLQRDCYCVSVY